MGGDKLREEMDKVRLFFFSTMSIVLIVKLCKA